MQTPLWVARCLGWGLALKRFGGVVLAGVLAAVASSLWAPVWADDVCRKYVPSAGVTIEVPCKPKAEEPAPVAAPADVMERRDGHELQGNAYRVITLNDIAACEQACLAETKCVAAEFYQKKNGCGLFDVVPPVVRAKFIDVSIRKTAVRPGVVKPAQGTSVEVTPKPSGAGVEAVAARAGQARPAWCSQQPKFNAAERLVCADTELSALDMELERVFGAAMAAKPGKADRGKLQVAEDAWAATRDDCQANRVCVKAAYELRIEQLRQQLGAVPKR